MQAIGLRLPEFDLVGTEAEASPIGGPRGPGLIVGRAGVLPEEIGDAAVEDFARGERSALGRRQGSNAAEERAGAPVGVGFGGGNRGDASGDADLAIQLRPEEEHGGARIGLQFLAFPAFVVGEEYEAAFAEFLEQNHARGGPAVGGGGGNGDGGGFGELRGLNQAVPLGELPHGIGVDGGFGQFSRGSQIPV